MAKSNKKAAEAEVKSETVAQEQPQAEPVQLTVTDLQLISRIIDLASRRGAFQAAELSQVGDVFNKLSSFLAFIEASQAKEKSEEAEASAE